MSRAPHHDRLRVLLDQRSSRADVQASYSDCSDTPSLYSPTAFSPGPSVHLDDHPPSMLDLDDDPRSSCPPSDPYHGDQSPYEDDGDLEPVVRMSYLGPKMRFHSRAPWELEDTPLDEANEMDDNPRHFTSGFPPSRATGQRPTTPGSSSPRPSFSSRPSVDSSSSHIPLKRSFETINSQISYPRGALYALAQESLSTTSLARGTVRPKETLTSKFSLGRLRPEPEAPTEPLPPSPIQSRFPSSLRGNEQSKPSFEANSSSSHDPYINKIYTTSVKESIHPYANPDLVLSYSEDQESVDDEHSTLTYTPPPRHDSVITVTESSSTGSIMKSSVRPTQSPDGPSTSRPRAVSIQAKNISSPVYVVGSAQRMDVPNGSTSLPPGVNNLPGWTERNAPPTFSLISLEEARAQRTRTSTANVPSRMSTSSGVSNLSTPFPVGAISHTQTTEPSTFVNLASRARGRSISAGAKAKNAIQTIVGQPRPERRDSEPAVTVLQSGNVPPGKSLKHKKSGFMRLFNGGKMQDKDGQDIPPPVPALPDMASSSQPLPRTPKPPAHRIPVPSLSPSLSELTSTESSDSFAGSNSWKASPSQKRLPPTLSINTIHEGPSSRSSTSAVAERPTNNMLQRPWQVEQPQSAPPIISEFPALKLRPVSTLFSAFSNHLVTVDSRTSAETVDATDVITPRSPSPNELISPVTPSSYSRISQDQIPAISIASSDQSTVKSLQEQLISARATWQRKVWELEGQVRDLKGELEEVKGRNGDEYCDTCGRGKKLPPASSGGGVVNRPRARTATSTRFGHPLP